MFFAMAFVPLVFFVFHHTAPVATVDEPMASSAFRDQATLCVSVPLW